METLKPLRLFLHKTNFTSVLLTVVAIFILYYRKNICIIIRTLPRDLRYLFRIIRGLLRVYKLDFYGETPISIFENVVVKKNPDKIVLYFQDASWTAKELDQYANKVARIFQKRGYKKGDVVAFMCLNRLEYMGIWLGLSKIGVITALINTNLKLQSLAHCVNNAQCRGFIFMSEFGKEVKDIRDSLSSTMEYFVYGDSTKFDDDAFKLDDLLEITNDDKIVCDYHMGHKDKWMYIYTSGTTGLPKPAVLGYQRIVAFVTMVKYIMGVTSDDIFYDSLPMYHGAGGIIPTVLLLMHGVAIVIRVKFSASNYISDCIKYKCTVGQYIGELCRYVLATPPSKNDTNHSLRMMLGNGMKPEVWKSFVERFKVPVISEIYGSTEGNCGIGNYDGTVGAVGLKPSFIPASLYSPLLIKYDETNDKPIRDKNGLCILCATGKPGMCVSIIRNSALRKYEGYTDKNESNKKIIYDVLRKGDSAYLSGDILYRDELGYYYFKDRIGDTYRWKGENVSTFEIEVIAEKFTNFKDCCVYGVQVGNLEGRAGMIAIADPKNEVDLEALAKAFNQNLPVYARPVFLRILSKLECTGTYKIQKVKLKKEGFNIKNITDKVYFNDPKKGFEELTESLYDDIINGVIKI